MWFNKESWIYEVFLWEDVEDYYRDKYQDSPWIISFLYKISPLFFMLILIGLVMWSWWLANKEYDARIAWERECQYIVTKSFSGRTNTLSFTANSNPYVSELMESYKSAYLKGTWEEEPENGVVLFIRQLVCDWER